MKRIVLGLALASLSGCHDFTAARNDCAAAGACVGVTPPSLVSSVPASASTGVALTGQIVLTFSEDMDKSSVKLALNPPVVLLGPAWASGGSTVATFTIGAAMQPNTLYLGSVDGKSLTGVALDPTQFTFTTADTTAPTVVMTPAQGATGVSPNVHLNLLFSEPMNVASVKVVSNPAYDWGVASWDSTEALATFDAPKDADGGAGRLQGNTLYTLTLTGKDKAGNDLALADRVKSFTTGAVPDTTPPTVLATTPETGSSAVDVAAMVSVTFSEPMQGNATTAVTFQPTLSASCAFDTSNTILTCQHSGQAFQPSTSYTVTISAVAKDLTGNPLAGAPFGFSFTTGALPDTTPPTMVSAPANGTSNVPVSSHLSLSFDEPMDETSLTVVSQPTYDFGAASWDPLSKVASFNAPDGGFAGTTQYTVVVNASDLAGNALPVSGRTIVFTTKAVPDQTPPTVLATQPEDGGQAVAVNGAITVTFSEPMDSSTTASLSFSPPFTGCSNTLDLTKTVLTCAHSATDLAGTTTYTATLSTAAKDTALNAMAAPYVFTFQTGSAPDKTPPTILSVSPGNTKTGILETTGFAVTFSEAVDKTSAQTAFSISNPTGMTWTFSWSSDGKTMYVTPSSSFPIGQTVSWQMSNAVKDLAGNAMASTQLYTFRVAYQTSTTLYADATDLTVYRDATSPYTYSSYAATSSYLYVGDNALTPDRLFRTALSFDLSGIPLVDGTRTSIVSSTLNVTAYSTTGTPYGSTLLGYLDADVISGSTKTSSASALWTGTAPYTCCIGFPPFLRCMPGCDSSYRIATVSFTAATKDVTYATQALQRGTLTFLLNFSRDTVVTTHTNAYVTLYSGNYATAASRPYLRVTYRYP